MPTTDGTSASDDLATELLEVVRCLSCGGSLALVGLDEAPEREELGPDGWLGCAGCGRRYHLRAGTLRALPDDATSEIKRRTAESFAYEWGQFGADRAEWEKNFRDYLRPHAPADLDGLLVLDVGCGSGRHSRQAAAAGARVVAVDLGDSIDVARANLPPGVLTVQADAERLPFEEGTFDFVMSIGVLHHLPDPERALRAVARFAKPHGTVHVYLYWKPERAWHRALLRAVTAARRVTTRLPHRVLHFLCYPLAAALFVAFVLPYRFARHRPALRWLAEALPLKAYADYPFGVCVNDQFDRLSAPIEHRYTADEVRAMLERAGLQDIDVIANYGWIGDGRRPA
jgi:2-polyprenyl-3-methyl-5-hydroxy-6-metoxy-1,4-benzoquinol methylase